MKKEREHEKATERKFCENAKQRKKLKEEQKDKVRKDQRRKEKNKGKERIGRKGRKTGEKERRNNVQNILSEK